MLFEKSQIMPDSAKTKPAVCYSKYIYIYIYLCNLLPVFILFGQLIIVSFYLLIIRKDDIALFDRPDKIILFHMDNSEEYLLRGSR